MECHFVECHLQRFRVNHPSVVHEAFDEEIVVVNLETGNYYSLSGTAPKIWMDLAEGRDLDEIVQMLQTRHAEAPEVLRAAVQTFADRLLAEALLVNLEEGGGARTQQSTQPVTPTAPPTPFLAPVIENYTDMQDLLMLDPIHDVDPSGWPAAKTDA